MSKITVIDQDVARMLSKEATEVLTKHFEKRGIAISHKGGSFTREYLKMPIVFAIRVERAGCLVAKTPEASAYELQRQFNKDMVPLGTVVNYCGRKYTITGWSTRSRKNPVFATRDDGVSFKLDKSAALLK